jgi:hypothetical protein
LLRSHRRDTLALGPFFLRKAEQPDWKEMEIWKQAVRLD